MLNKKMKSILAVALCAVMTIVAIPMLPAKAEGEETTTCTDCAECTDYKMTINDVTPGVKSDWESFRTVEDTDTGLKVTYPNDGDSRAYSTRTTTPVALDGAHMKLTTSGNARFIVVINNGGDSYNDNAHGLKIRIEKWTSKVTCLIDNDVVVEQQTLEHPIDDTVTDEIIIKTTIKENGDLNIAINDNNIVIEKAKWEASSYMNANSSYFLISNNDGTGYAFTYTWNYIHSGEDVCYSEVAAVDTLIENMQTGAENIEARKAYLILSDAEKALVDNAEILLSTIGTLEGDSAGHLVTESDIYPKSTDNSWGNNRKLTPTTSGLRVTHASSSVAYNIRNATPVSVDGAHMKLTFHSTTNKFIITITDMSTGWQNYGQGLPLVISLYGATVQYTIDGVTTTVNLTNVSSATTEVVMETSVTEEGNFVFTINGNEIVINKESLAKLTFMNLNSSYYLITPQQTIDYTWNYFHGGDAVCYNEFSDAEAKIELCHPTTPIKAYVEAARNAYDSLSDELKAIVLNYDKLTTAEAKVTQTDFCNYGITEGNFLTDNSGTGWDPYITRKQVSSGWNVDFHWGTLGPAFRVRWSKNIQLDGAHIGVTMEHTGYDYCLISLSNDNTNSTAGDVYLTLDTRNKTAAGHGNKYYLGFGDPVNGPFTNASTVGLPGNYDGSSVNFPDISDDNKMDIRCDVDAQGNLYVTINGRYIKLTAEQLATIGFDVTKDVYVGFSTTSGKKPNVTVNYIVSGNTDSYDAVTGDTNGDTTMNVLDLARMKNNEEAEIKDILYYRTSSDLDKDGNSCDAEDLDLLRKELVK